MELQLTAGPPRAQVAHLYRQLREAIVAGHVPPGQRLPATRSVAADTGVSRTTVTQAYERLIAEGLAEGTVGSGTFVTDAVTALGSLRRARPVALTLRPGPAPNGDLAVGGPIRFDLRHGRPDARLFPHREWRTLLLAATGRADLLTAPYAFAGEPELRSAVAHHLGRSRGLDVDADDVVITRGAQQAIDLTARALLAPGDRAVVEVPGYLDAAAAFTGTGARLHGVRVDEHGLVTDDLPRTAALAYVTPSHQAPLGSVLSVERRVALLQWASHCGAAILEDDYDTEYRWGRRALDPLRTLDQEGRVVYVGSVSKTLSPRLRLGWLVAPPNVRDAVLALKEFIDPWGERAPQQALARFLDEGRFAVHLRRTSTIYGERRSVLLRLLAALPGVDILSGEAGLHVTIGCGPDEPYLDGVVAACARDGLALRALHRTAAPARAHRRGIEFPLGLVLGYGGIDVDDLPAAVDLLARHLRA